MAYRYTAEQLEESDRLMMEEYERQKDHDQIVGEFLRVLAECGNELDLISDYVKEDKLGVDPDDVTLANVGDARALLLKLREVSESLGWDHLPEEQEIDGASAV